MPNTNDHTRSRASEREPGHMTKQLGTPSGAELASASPEARAQAISDWLIAHVANLLRRSPSEIAHDVPLSRYGVDSASAVDVTGAIEEWVGIELDPVLVFEYPTIQGLAAHLSEILGERAANGGAL
jgi:acyl carrier protein